MGVIATTKPNAPGPAERRELSSALIKLPLGVDESRAYWQHADARMPVTARVNAAFEQRWFGSKSLPRVRDLIRAFAMRYDAFPDALAALHLWRDMSPATRRLICHWHVQLVDPLYRAFTGELLVQRRAQGLVQIDQPTVARWVRERHPDRFQPGTVQQYARKLLSVAAQAGLVRLGRDPRAVITPTVPDDALAYVMHLLHSVRFEGSLVANPYLASVGLDGTELDRRLRRIDALGYRRMGDVTEFNWAQPGLRAWAEVSL